MNNLLFDIDSSIEVVSKEVGKNFVTLELTLTEIFYKPIEVSFYGYHLSIDTPYMIKYPDTSHWDIIHLPPLDKGHC